jgi:hypothetical protein
VQVYLTPADPTDSSSVATGGHDEQRTSWWCRVDGDRLVDGVWSGDFDGEFEGERTQSRVAQHGPSRPGALRQPSIFRL